LLRRIALVLLLPSLALADQKSETAVLPVEINGQLPPDDYAALNEAMAAHAGGARAVPVEERANVDPLRCERDAKCWAKVGKKLGARRVMVAVLDTAKMKLEAWLIDVDGAKVVGQGRRILPRRSSAAFTHMPGKLASELMWNAPRLPAVKQEEEQPSRNYDPAAKVFAETPPGLAPEVVAAPAPGERPGDRRLLRPQALVGVRVGVLVPQAFNSLGTTFLVEVEAAYQLPFWKRRLGLFLDVSYTEPQSSGTRNDARIITSGGSVDWNLKVQEVGFVLGLQLRFAVGRWVVPYLGAGARLDLTATTLSERSSGGGADAGSWHEQSSRFGAHGRLGVGIHAGPGDLLLEARVDWTPIDHTLTGNTNTGRVGFALGYLVRL
jgi:hypothetical protein